MINLQNLKLEIQYAATWIEIEEIIQKAIKTFGKDACKELIEYSKTRKDWVR